MRAARPPTGTPVVHDAQGLRLAHWPTWQGPEMSDAWFAQLRKDTPWQQEHLRMFGREIAVPRLVAWYGDVDATYTYSGIVHDPLPWTPLLQEIRSRVEATSGARFNSVLLNYYRSGRDSMGWHADDERELGEAPTIASVSLGAQRTMQFKHKRDGAAPRHALDLPHGSLLVMHPPTQDQWLHQIPKRKGVAAPTARINLTFRYVESN